MVLLKIYFGISPNIKCFAIVKQTLINKDSNKIIIKNKRSIFRNIAVILLKKIYIFEGSLIVLHQNYNYFIQL